MKKRIMTLILMLTLALFTAARPPQNEANADEALPPGDWTLVSHPYQGPDFEALPVVVYSVTSGLKGLTIKYVGIWNRSPNLVTAVKLSWHLRAEQDPQTILREGQTPSITFRKGLPSGMQQAVRHPIVSFLKIYQPLLKRGVLKGNYILDVAVSEVSYEDGSRWIRGETRKVDFVKAVSVVHSTPVQTGCPKQNCALMTGGAGYTCQASFNNEYCTNKI